MLIFDSTKVSPGKSVVLCYKDCRCLDLKWDETRAWTTKLNNIRNVGAPLHEHSVNRPRLGLR